MEKRDVKLSGITIDSKLKFDKHVLEIYSKAGRKLRTLTQMPKWFHSTNEETCSKHSLNPSLNIVSLYGSSRIALQIIELIDYMTGLCV